LRADRVLYLSVRYLLLPIYPTGINPTSTKSNNFGMAKRQKKQRKASTGRERVTYCAVPIAYAPLLDKLTEDGEKYEGNSRAQVVKRALKLFLQAEGLLDDKGKPKQQGEAKG
jgi:hypothetical protein